MPDSPTNELHLTWGNQDYVVKRMVIVHDAVSRVYHFTNRPIAHRANV